MGPSEIPTFVMANGQKNNAMGKVTLLLNLHNFQGTLAVHILADDHLCMPLLFGLDFMTMSQITLKPHLRKYIMAGGKDYTFLVSTISFYVAMISPRDNQPANLRLRVPWEDCE